LPFKNLIDYKKLCISLHISEINKLEDMLVSITEDEYKQMFEYYEEIKHLFELEGMSNQIIKENGV
jgi:hemoglobin-like flavoprotein